ncbi:DUF4342 domain-containing protein [Alkaliphilus transvaalensis]|uniref:DUF4342 domain-containing protein n=1 Tax=Alkaliphilus transvaalensis TaxID=114628 RepID=UPI00047E2F22|nr:DUF4342 domain-containing protein [Alkaliphilus transvaalensis]
MDINLEKIDTIRERTGVSYKEAKEVLERNNGNLVDSLIELEEKGNKNWSESLGIAGNDIIEKLKRIIKTGNVTRVILKKDGEIMLNIPVTAGAVGVVLAPLVSIIGVSAAVASKATIEIVKKDGEVVDINDYAEGKVNEIKNIFKGNKEDLSDMDFMDGDDSEVKVDVDLNKDLEDTDDGADK